MTAPELLPCPFCGKVAHLRDDVCHSTAFFVGCETLGCFGNALWDETQEEAVSKWNTRADDAKAVLEAVRREARAEALREAADLARENWRSWDNATPIECDATACEYISDAILALIDNPTQETQS